MNILILCKKFPYPLKDGEAIAIFNNIKAFSRLGHKVTVLAINTLKHYYDVNTLPEAVLELADLHAVTVDTGIKASDALHNLFSGESYHIERFISPEYDDRLKELITSVKFDMIQCEGLYQSPYLETIRKHSQAPVIMRAHNVESEIWERMVVNTANPLKKWYLNLQTQRLKQYEKEQLNRYDAIVPITEDDKQKLVALGATVPMFTSSAGIDLERFQGYENIVPDKGSIGFIGGLDWLPNQEGLKWFLDKVWPKILNHPLDAELRIAGRNAPSWLTNLSKDGVKVVGEVDDALDFIARQQVMIVPLFSGSGMRIKIIEAMATGKAVISTTIGAEGILYTDGDNILIANTEQDYVQQLSKCLGEPQLAENIGKNARRLIETSYDNLKFAEHLIEFYNRQFFQ